MRLRWFLVPVLVLCLVACGGDDGPAATPTSTLAPVQPTLPPLPTQAPRATSTPVAVYEAGTRTDIEVIDGVLAALEAGDGAAMLEQLSFHPYRCNGIPSGMDGTNPCPPGVAEGSAVDVIAWGDCTVAFLARERANLAPDVAAYTTEASQQGLYAVVEVQEGRLPSPLPLRYLIILSGGYALLLDDAGVTHFGKPCGGVQAATLFHPADRPILLPR